MGFKYQLSKVDMSDYAHDSIQDARVMHERRIVRAAHMEAENTVLHAALLNARPLRSLTVLSTATLLLDNIRMVDGFRAEGVDEGDIKIYVAYYGKALDEFIKEFECLSPRGAYNILHPGNSDFQ